MCSNAWGFESPLPHLGSFVSKVVIPVKTGIQFYINRHDFWIPTYVGMTKSLKNGTYDTSHPEGKGKIILKGLRPSLTPLQSIQRRHLPHNPS
jgi:hypothetical protein